jgi:hypothetical protein
MFRDPDNGYIANSEMVVAPQGAYYVEFCSYNKSLTVLKYENLNLRHTDY